MHDAVTCFLLIQVEHVCNYCMMGILPFLFEKDHLILFYPAGNPDKP
jgi:hypothetical protein